MAEPRIVRSDDPAAAPVLAGLSREYSELYGTVVQDDLAFYEPTEFAPPTGAFYIVQAEGRTVAGGALRRLAASVGEIKRMWTAPSHRGRGYARRVLAGLEDVAVGYGYGAVRLEPGLCRSRR